MKRIILVLIHMISISMIGTAQSEKALTLSVVKESTKLPSGRAFGSPFHPGIEFGYDHFLTTDTKHSFFLSIKLGYFHHKDFQHGITIKPAINYTYKTKNNILVGTEINIGYLHTFRDKPLYKQDESGKYQKIRNFGKPRFMPSIALSLGYQFQRQDKKHLDLFIKYEFGIETPFSKGIGIPIFPHSFIHLGTRWYAFN